VWLRAARDLPRFLRQSTFRTWLFGIAVNRCREIIRMTPNNSEELSDDIAMSNGPVDAAGAPASSRPVAAASCGRRLKAAVTGRQNAGAPNAMAKLIEKPTVVEAAGNKPKRIEEFIGRVASDTKSVSIARMKSPSGWVEPGQTPAFDEYTVVLAGMLRVTTRDGQLDVRAGQAVITPGGNWVQYSTPSPEGAEYIAVCVPAFAPENVHRDGQ